MTQQTPLICPVDGELLQRADDGLTCPRGDHHYPIVNGIPRFVPESSYADAFGAQWKKYRKTQLDSYTGTTLSKDRLNRCLGPQVSSQLKEAEVLECGCGAGRFTEPLLDAGAEVTSIDLSSAVDANVKNCPVTASHRVLQADIRHIPVAKHHFDVVICLGVIQHTPLPEETIACLYNQVKPGGWLVIDHYTFDLSHYTKPTYQLLRPYFLRLPPDKTLRYTERLVDFFLPLHRLARSSRVLQALVSRVSPLLTYYQAFPELNDQLQREWALLDTHDGLTDYYKHFRSVRSIRGVLEGLGMVSISAAHGGNGVEARGQRPPSAARQAA